jgi:hypothetical protein
VLFGLGHDSTTKNGYPDDQKGIPKFKKKKHACGAKWKHIHVLSNKKCPMHSLNWAARPLQQHSRRVCKFVARIPLPFSVAIKCSLNQQLKQQSGLCIAFPCK